MSGWIEHITTEGERWDNLAFRYYGDPLGYERIISANPHIAIAATLASGLRLRIPVIGATQVHDVNEVPPWLR
ncbi:tail protein X [Lelliottia wanjuensis]|uniref:tail protein X n=1 Tax=Lelliottia wanjuensis TaxID=3050585 RepID=UPI002551BDBC|nr:tail protein X [Lelliottia sp. V104_15]MDK9603497.1 tail protein X [Lelliottia sp. V104_15]